jgi:hypothetical protein
MERDRQDIQWGQQDHPDGTGDPALATYLLLARERIARAVQDGELNWMLILNEEFAEACVETDPDKLRIELIQVAAVAVAWVEAIERRRTHG